MAEILDAVRDGASGETLADIPLPTSTRAVFVLRDEQDMFEGMMSKDKDPRRSLHVDEVPLPELAPDEVFLAVMASSINFNTVWT
ncbi:MAG TPA: crotonyl-CoA carboxylase/reductase, partial [Acidimicrobiales bacterium]